MGDPQVPIDVNEETGIWTTDDLPMLYVPRHFFVNNHELIEKALGREVYAKSLYQAGYKSAYHWCSHEAEGQNLSGMLVFQHYMTRLSQRGWGIFDGSGIDEKTGLGSIILHNSCFVLHSGPDAGRKLCYMSAGWFPGALDWVSENLNRETKYKAEETRCAGEGYDFCQFDVTPL